MPNKLSASQASKHMACHASANLEVAIPGYVEPPRTRNGTAQAGTDVHKVIEDLIGIQYITASKTSNFTARDMLAAGKLITYIGELWSKRRFKILSEHKMTAWWLATKPTTTADVILYTQDEIHVLDPKWGKILVEVANNAQLIYYAACAAPLAPKAKGVWVHILQPRIDNMAAVFITTTEIQKFIEDSSAAEAAIQAGDVTFNPGDHCTFCPANPHTRGAKGKPSCPAMMELLGYGNPPLDEDELLNL